MLDLISVTSATGSSNSIDGLSGNNQSTGASANISTPGQLFSDLQQLQSQNSTEFTQVVSQIASQIQSASQSVQGSLSQYLQNLSGTFQNIASTGDLNQLSQTPPLGPPQTYNSNGQGVQSPASGIGQLLQQLFTTISQDVSQALSPTTGTTSVTGAGKS